MPGGRKGNPRPDRILDRRAPVAYPGRVKICICGIAGLPAGRHNLRDPRLDKAHELVEARKKVHAQVDVVGPEGAMEADAILASPDALTDLVLQDLELVETRLGRDPSAEERAALLELQAHLEAGQPVSTAALGEAAQVAMAAHGFVTGRPVVMAAADQSADPDALLLRAFAAAGHICFLTVGGPENRAWPIRRGATAAEAAGAIHTALEKGFIRAEVIGFDDFLAFGGDTGAKRAGRQRLEMRHYLVQDYDVMNIRANR